MSCRSRSSTIELHAITIPCAWGVGQVRLNEQRLISAGGGRNRCGRQLRSLTHSLEAEFAQQNDRAADLQVQAVRRKALGVQLLKKLGQRQLVQRLVCPRLLDSWCWGRL